MRTLFHLVLFLLLTLVRFSLVPALPINFIPLIFWLLPPRSTLVWQLLLFGLINDIFAFPPQFGLTALSFSLLTLFIYFIHSTIPSRFATLLIIALALTFISQLSSLSGSLLPQTLLPAFFCLLPFVFLAKIRYQSSSLAVS